MARSSLKVQGGGLVVELLAGSLAFLLGVAFSIAAARLALHGVLLLTFGRGRG